MQFLFSQFNVYENVSGLIVTTVLSEVQYLQYNII